MTVIEKIIDRGIVEAFVNRFGQGEQEFDRDDLIQDIYEDLMMKDQEKLAGIWERDEMDYFIYRIVINNLFSRTSRYHRQYRVQHGYDTLDKHDKADKTD